VQGDSHTDKRVHYVKFVRSVFAPPRETLKKVWLTVIPTFVATSHQVGGIHLKFEM